MTKTYVIFWKSKSNGRTGTGTINFDREEAEQLASELNRDYPDIHHEARNTAAEPEKATLPLEAADPQPA
jgi:hypothetical protein